MTKFGYILYSPDGARLKEDSIRLTNSGCSIVYGDPYEKNSDQHNFKLILKIINSGDAIVVTDLSYFVVNLKTLIPIIDELESKSIHLICLDNSIDTTKYGMTKTFQLLRLFNNVRFEWQSRIAISTIRNNQLQGKAHGAPKGLSRRAFEKAKQAYELKLEGRLSIIEILELVKISRGTLYRYVEYGEKGLLENEEIIKKPKIVNPTNRRRGRPSLNQ